MRSFYLTVMGIFEAVQATSVKIWPFVVSFVQLAIMEQGHDVYERAFPSPEGRFVYSVFAEFGSVLVKVTGVS